ncbi:carbohydrate ABC transporter permease [Bacillus sp. FJAT-44742]|uniref:carbohydrate ABC transporter permease n=1 Tax=Bacillus sp. FJAT-44742 TaxID=2014005 RepID=UPI0018E20151|nr:carbohydrate ABC transporter permease [Bacillus sp. FJAT-44742]
MPAFRGYLFNSLFVSGTTTLIVILLSSLAGYGFSRLTFKGKRFFFNSFLSVQMIPGIVLLIPLFFILQRLTLIDTYTGLIVTYVAFSLPFCTWIMTSFYNRIPKELEEAAFMDGATRFQAFYKVVVPLSFPGVLAVGIFSFLIAWDEFLFALTLTDSESKRTLPYGLYSFMNQYGVEWNTLMAAAILTMIPPIIIFLVIYKYFSKEFLSGH